MAKEKNDELDKALENLRVDLNKYSKHSPLSWVLPITTVLLVIFKCLGYISISWWWVFAPIWAPILLTLILVILIGLLAMVVR